MQFTSGPIKACEIREERAHGYACLIVERPQHFFIWIPRAQEQSQAA